MKLLESRAVVVQELPPVGIVAALQLHCFALRLLLRQELNTGTVAETLRAVYEEHQCQVLGIGGMYH